MNKTIEERLSEIEKQLDNLNDAKKIDSIFDMLKRLKKLESPLEIVSAKPTTIPKNFVDYFKRYHNGAAYGIYVYTDGDWTLLT